MKKYSAFLVLIICLGVVFWKLKNTPEFMSKMRYFVAEERILTHPKISLILPTYNRATLLPRAIDSILNQTYPDFELIVINDGSADKTQEILEEYAAKDKRIKVINHEKNKGLVAGLNEGLEQAKGEYIARMDDDDVSYPERFEKQLAYMEEHPEYTAVGTWVSIFKNMSQREDWIETNPERIKILLLLGFTTVVHPSMMIRNSFLKEHHIRYREGYDAAEDLAFRADIIFAGGKLSNVPKVLMYFRKHISNSGSYYKKQKKSNLRFQQDYLKRYFNIELEKRTEVCQVLHMLKKAKDVEFPVDKGTLKKVMKYYCKKFGTFEYPQFKETIYTRKNWLYRTKVLEKGLISRKNKDIIVVRWEKSGKDVFRIKDDQTYEQISPEEGEI